jgi:hypothetical protein
MRQLPLDFNPHSTLNVDRLKGQNHRLYEYLKQGESIHVFHPAKRELQIGYLNSRVSDLVKAGVEIHKRIIHVPDINGEDVAVKEYSLKPFT